MNCASLVRRDNFLIFFFDQIYFREHTYLLRFLNSFFTRRAFINPGGVFSALA